MATALTNKVGGVPMWAWGAAVVLGGGTFLYFRHRASTASQAATSATDNASSLSGLYNQAIPIVIPDNSQSNTGLDNGFLGSPGPSSAPPTAPTGTLGGGTGVVPPMAPPPPTSTPPVAPAPPAPLPPLLNPDLWPHSAPQGSAMTIVSVATGGGGQSGYWVIQHAPVYALINGTWLQGFNIATLPAGTPMAIPSSLAPAYIGSHT